MTLIRKIIYHGSRTEFSRYFLAGSLTFLVDFLLLLLLTELAGINYLWSNLVSVSVGIMVSYFICIGWVFSDRRYNRISLEFPLFVLTCLVGLVLNEGLMWVYVAKVEVHYLVAKVIVTAIVFVFNFCLKKRALFNKKNGL